MRSHHYLLLAAGAACGLPQQAPRPAPVTPDAPAAAAAVEIGASTRAPEAAPATSAAYAPVGLFIASIEEGARIFTPARLVPFAHPEALGHDFPTVLQLHGTEYPMLVWLGRQVGFGLQPTLQRYPREPGEAWPYPDIRQPPDTAALRRARVIVRPVREAPLPGLRAVLYDGRDMVAFIVDTRGLTLAERGMRRPTAMGLDASRATFLERLGSAAPSEPLSLTVMIWER